MGSQTSPYCEKAFPGTWPKPLSLQLKLVPPYSFPITQHFLPFRIGVQHLLTVLLLYLAKTFANSTAFCILSYQH